MVRQMKLKGQIRVSSENLVLTFISKLYDNTPFEVTVDKFDVELNDSFSADRLIVDGWLFVVEEAKQADRCYLTLPKPNITFGRQVLVNELQLMPRVSSIADFKPQKIGGKVTQMKLVEVEKSEVVSKKSTKKKKSTSKDKVAPIQ